MCATVQSNIFCRLIFNFIYVPHRYFSAHFHSEKAPLVHQKAIIIQKLTVGVVVVLGVEPTLFLWFVSASVGAHVFLQGLRARQVDGDVLA